MRPSDSAADFISLPAIRRGHAISRYSSLSDAAARRRAAVFAAILIYDYAHARRRRKISRSRACFTAPATPSIPFFEAAESIMVNFSDSKARN